MFELIQHLVTLEWRRRGAALRETAVAGSRVRYAEFPARPRLARQAPSRGAGRDERPTTVVLLHGIPSSSIVYDSVIPSLREGCRVIAPDLPGCGSSRLPEGRDFLTLRELVDVVEGFLGRVTGGGACVVGHCIAGLLAVRVAARRPGLVHGLGLLSPSGAASGIEEWGDFKQVIAAVESGASQEFLRRTFHKPPLIMRLFLRDLRRMIQCASVMRPTENLDTEDLVSAEELSKVRCPAVLVWGDRDELVPDGCRRFFLQHLNGLRYEHLPECGHVPQLESPKRTAEILLDLARAGAGVAPPTAAAPRAGGNASRGARGGRFPAMPSRRGPGSREDEP
jgi:pimeloyl-ACP methyl ester carboxylesterase